MDWVAEAERLTPSGSPGSPAGGGAKAILHVTTGVSAGGTFDSMHQVLIEKQAEPHFLYDPKSDRLGQYFSMGQTARALVPGTGGVSNNKAGSVVIQVEVVADPDGFTRYWTPGPNFIAMMNGIRSRGVPDKWMGHIASSATDCVRMSYSEYQSMNGWTGHCSVPGNDHWDPGPIDAAEFFAKGGGDGSDASSPNKTIDTGTSTPTQKAGTGTVDYVTQQGAALYVHFKDKSVLQCVPHSTRQHWIAGTGSSASSGGSSGSGGSGGIEITAQMVEAAVTSVGGSTSAMLASAQGIADSFNNAIAKTYPGLLTNKKRAACLVGECAQETDWFKTTTEYTAGSNSYSPYDGRGFIQLTWEGNYAGFGRWMKSLGALSDANYFVDNPTRLADVKWAGYTAIYYFTQVKWDSKNLMQICDGESSPWSRISRAINRGNPDSGSPAYGESERTTAINAVLAVTPDPTPTDPPASSSDGGNRVAAFIKTLLDKYRYNQGPGRLDPENSGYTDCSALMHYVYQKILGKEIGTWTGGQQKYGTVVIDTTSAPVDESKMQPGDLVFFNWDGPSSTFDHVDMYIGNNQVCGHGGPDNGPNIKPLASRCAYAYNYRVRRYA